MFILYNYFSKLIVLKVLLFDFPYLKSLWVDIPFHLTRLHLSSLPFPYCLFIVTLYFPIVRILKILVLTSNVECCLYFWVNFIWITSSAYISSCLTSMICFHLEFKINSFSAIRFIFIKDLLLLLNIHISFRVICY
jgi:hypothetical protein